MLACRSAVREKSPKRGSPTPQTHMALEASLKTVHSHGNMKRVTKSYWLPVNRYEEEKRKNLNNPTTTTTTIELQYVVRKNLTIELASRLARDYCTNS